MTCAQFFCSAAAVLVDPSGAQVLPDIRDERSTVSSWQAWSACSADQRTKSPVHAELARRLIIREKAAA